MRIMIRILAALAVLWGVAQISDVDAAPVTTPSGLQIIDIKPGTGPTPQPGQICVVRYTGWLWKNGTRGKKFDSSAGRRPFEFPLGEGRVIAGWDEGVASMQVGGKRNLIIPPDLAYGEAGAGNGIIPPDATLIFEIELLAIKG